MCDNFVLTITKEDFANDPQEMWRKNFSKSIGPGFYKNRCDFDDLILKSELNHIV
jgi:hypothetical protein